ncbi:MAG: VWA domain-containing protein [Phycisphaerales bacterium]|nr:VWA domain-containing protein [Phycisphaerales bacterium]
MAIRFEQPELLWLIPICVLVTIWMARRSLTGLRGVKRWVVLVMRCILIMVIVTALAKPRWAERSSDVTLLVVVDQSYSMPSSKLNVVTHVIGEALDRKRADDRLALVAAADEAWITSMPNRLAAFDPTAPDSSVRDATNLAAGVRLAMAVAPHDTAARILLVSDGLETVDSVRSVAQLCLANGIPVDVIPITYDHPSEVVFDSVIVPAQARPGQAMTVKLVLRSTGYARGRIGLLRNGQPVDLNPGEPGTTFAVDVKPGPNTFSIPVDVPNKGVYRWQAYFESAAGDRVEMPATEEPGGALAVMFILQAQADELDNPNNNIAEAVTFVYGEGTVLVIDRTGEESRKLVEALRASRINVEVKQPEDAVMDVVALSVYDAIILTNVPAYDLSYEQQEALRAYVHDVGGGLVMVGGPDSFGAGGWIASPVADALPVKLDPPQTRQIPRGALVMIMHSTEMAQGNFWAEKCAIAAVNGLTRKDLVGVIDYNWQGGDTWEYKLQEVGDRSAVNRAIKNMPVGDMPSFESSLSMALDALVPARAGQKSVIIFSDGDASRASGSTILRCVKNKITVTCVMIAGHGTQGTMKDIAKKTGGEFFHIRNPKKLPELFQKIAIETQRSLIVEGETYSLTQRSLIGPTAGLRGELPTISGYVLTTDRGGKSNIGITSNLGDPICASWQYGLGKAVACTFDVNPTRWANNWVPWENFEEFWERTIRWVMRPAKPRNVSILTEQDGDIVRVELRILTDEGEFANDEHLRARVIDPANESEPLRMSQIGPGRYAGEFRVSRPGAYLVSMITGMGGTGTAVRGGSIQAAVAVPFSREFRAVKSNNALLQDIADMTGGRYLTQFDPQATDLFDRTGLTFPETLTDVWPLFAMIAVGVFILDVGIRRVAIDVPAVIRWTRSLLAKRAEATTESMEAFKRSRAEVGSRLRGSKKRAAEAEHIDGSARFEADESQAGAVLPLEGDMPEKPHRAPRRDRLDETPPSASDADDDRSVTARLLDAKRRARRGPITDDEEASDA